MTVNGKKYDRNYLKHGDLVAGAEIGFVMSAEANTSRGTGKAGRPYSFSNE